MLGYGTIATPAGPPRPPAGSPFAGRDASDALPPFPVDVADMLFGVTDAAAAESAAAKSAANLFENPAEVSNPFAPGSPSYDHVDDSASYLKDVAALMDE